MAISMLLQRSVNLGFSHLLLPVPVFYLPASQRHTEQMGSEKKPISLCALFSSSKSIRVESTVWVTIAEQTFLGHWLS